MNRATFPAALVIITLGLSSRALAADIVLVGSTIGIDVKKLTDARPVLTGRADLQALARGSPTSITAGDTPRAMSKRSRCGRTARSRCACSSRG